MGTSNAVASYVARLESTPYLLISTLAVLSLALIYHTLQHRPLSKLPGPWYSAFTGIVLFYHEYQGTRRLYVHDLHRRYGSTVRLSPSEASFTGAGAIKQIYGGAHGYDKPRFFDLFIEQGARNIFTYLGKDEHARAKRRFAERYSNSAILKPCNLDAIKERAQAFLTKCLTQCEQVKDADIYRGLHAYALDCVTHVLFAPFGTKSIDDPAFYELIDILAYHDSRKGLVLKHYSPFLYNIWSRIGAGKTNHGSQVVDYLSTNIHRPSNTNTNTDDSLADFTVASKLKTFSPDMTSSEIYSECADHLFAGVETTADTLCFLIWHISQPAHTHIQRRLQSELQTIMKATNTANTELDGEQLQKLHQLPYLNALVDEALRLFTPGSLSLFRETPTSVRGGGGGGGGGGSSGEVINGYLIPAGTTVASQVYTVHRDGDSYGPDPEAFRPERWLKPGDEDDDDGKDERDEAMTQYEYEPADQNATYLAFGKGPRACIGKYLARAEMKHLLYAVYSQCSTVANERRMRDNGYSMEMSDQLLTVRPRDLVCFVNFEKLSVRLS